MKQYTSTHFQTGEVRRGTFDELADLDKRMWELKEVPAPASHSHVVQHSLGKVHTITTHPVTGDKRKFYAPVFNDSKFVGGTNGRENPNSSTIGELRLPRF